MSDRTFMNLIIVDANDDQLDQIKTILEHHIGDYFDREDYAPGAHFGFEEVVCGRVRDAAEDLRNNVPGTSWKMWDEPAYEWLGTVLKYTPDLGLFSHDCDNEGTPLFDPDEIETILKNALGDITRIEELLGITHDRALFPEDTQD